jgi:GH25 family lysozyme M1 (1,4-beta-N-acetylmuramidase)
MANTSKIKLKPRSRRKSPATKASPSVSPPAATRLVGSDVYESDSMDWVKVKGQLDFLIMRAHYGTAVDKQFANYWPASKAAGFRSGAYGFLLPNQSVDSQIDTAVQAIKSIGGFQPGDMGFFADAENPRAWLKLPRGAALSPKRRLKTMKDIVAAWHTAMPNATTRMNFLLAYLNGIKEKANLPLPPGLYVSPSFLQQVFTDLTPLAETPLWIAHWEVKKPAVPLPWSANNPQYQLWQDLGDAWAVPGINGGKKNKADRDWFPGTIDDFNKVFGKPTEK